VDADVDLLLIAVFCTADDFLPKRAGNARRKVTDAEVITLRIGQGMLGISSDERFLAPGRHRLVHLFQALPTREAFHILGLERHGARTLRNLFVRMAIRFAALAAALSLDHQLRRPSRSIACYTTEPVPQVI
jgi:hypothetical protein